VVPVDTSESPPVTVLIDSSGWIRMYHLAYRSGDERNIERTTGNWLDRIKEKIETVGPVEGRTSAAASGQETIKEPPSRDSRPGMPGAESWIWKPAGVIARR
jgi:hypothetical protein